MSLLYTGDSVESGRKSAGKLRYYKKIPVNRKLVLKLLGRDEGRFERKTRILLF